MNIIVLKKARLSNPLRPPHPAAHPPLHSSPTRHAVQLFVRLPTAKPHTFLPHVFNQEWLKSLPYLDDEQTQLHNKRYVQYPRAQGLPPPPHLFQNGQGRMLETREKRGKRPLRALNGDVELFAGGQPGDVPGVDWQAARARTEAPARASNTANHIVRPPPVRFASAPLPHRPGTAPRRASRGRRARAGSLRVSSAPPPTKGPHGVTYNLRTSGRYTS